MIILFALLALVCVAAIVFGVYLALSEPKNNKE